MKATVQKEVHVCDACGAQEDYVSTCLHCGAEHCHQCQRAEGTHYSHGVHCGGTGDGYYCKSCDAKLTLSGTSKKHAAYRRIASLRIEAKAWGAEFERRRVEAEKALEALQK